MRTNPYYPPAARVSDPPLAEHETETVRSRRATSRLVVALAGLAWLTPFVVSAAVWGGLLEGVLTDIRWAGFRLDLLAPGYGLFVAIPAFLFAVTEIWARRSSEQVFTALFLSSLYGVAAIAWFSGMVFMGQH